MREIIECEVCRLKGWIKEGDKVSECPVCGNKMILVIGWDKPPEVD